MHERHEGIDDQDQANEEQETELLPELHQNQVRANVGGGVGCWDPCSFPRSESERSLEIGQVCRDEVIAKAARQTGEEADEAIGYHPLDRVVGVERRARDDRALVWLELISSGHAQCPFTRGD